MNEIKKTRTKRKGHKNFFPTFILIIIFWGITIGIVGFVEPNLVSDILIPRSYLLFFLPLFIALFFTLSVVFVSSRRGLLTASVVILFLILRLIHLGNLLNLILLVGLTIAIDYYFTQKH